MLPTCHASTAYRAATRAAPRTCPCLHTSLPPPGVCASTALPTWPATSTRSTHTAHLCALTRTEARINTCARTTAAQGYTSCHATLAGSCPALPCSLSPACHMPPHAHLLDAPQPRRFPCHAHTTTACPTFTHCTLPARATTPTPPPPPQYARAWEDTYKKAIALYHRHVAALGAALRARRRQTTKAEVALPPLPRARDSRSKGEGNPPRGVTATHGILCAHIRPRASARAVPLSLRTLRCAHARSTPSPATPTAFMR